MTTNQAVNHSSSQPISQTVSQSVSHLVSCSMPIHSSWLLWVVLLRFIKIYVVIDKIEQSLYPIK